jgi:light-regulated signal transduction histidine kinase (bacteriophytochrome)
MTSHALQEPLHILSHYTQLFAQRYKGKFDADADNIISHILEGTTRMQKLINGLRTYSYVDRRGRPFEPMSCEAVLKQALTKRQATIEKSGGVITHESLPIVMADASQLVQLFEKLIGNAIKYRNEELPRIHISAQRKENEWIFSVRDNGIGIAPEYQECIFLIFQRLHKREEYPGNGTGLAICKRIVERHGGRIWVESKPGNGSTFYFTIPENLHVPPPL